MGRIGILGGTFDPPHIGHLFMAEEARIKMELDEIWWMPNRIPPHKEKKSNTTEQDRLDMVVSMATLHHNYSVCDVELKREGISYTFDTMVELTRMYPKHEFFFIIGGDSLEMLNKWYKQEELRELVSFIVIQRLGYESDKNKEGKGITIIEGPMVVVSSSSIRKAFQEGKVNKFLLTDAVYTLIKERCLYE
ncbi:MAG: nicotinate-nucleotide adenylyltransferase [Bacillus sp. (in: Bacteria)]|nr:nicotinate-nucleotide adenylyltransferase [Bacillus sp. (in: firmicutes)]